MFDVKEPQTRNRRCQDDFVVWLVSSDACAGLPSDPKCWKNIPKPRSLCTRKPPKTQKPEPPPPLRNYPPYKTLHRVLLKPLYTTYNFLHPEKTLNPCASLAPDPKSLNPTP